MLKIEEEPDEIGGEEEQALYEHHNIKVEKAKCLCVLINLS